MNSDSSSSSEDASDSETNTDGLADLLWHKVAQKVSKSSSDGDKIGTLTVSQKSPEPSKPSSSGSSTSLCATSSSKPEQRANNISQIVSKLIEGKGNTDKSPKTPQPREPPSKMPAVRSLYKEEAEKLLKSAVNAPKAHKSERESKRESKLERSQWKWGKGKWSSMRMAEQTEEQKKDLMVLGMRSTIDPVRHYKHTDLKTPKFFQMGTVVDDAYNFYTDRIPKKKRKRTLVDELMADEEFKQRVKQQYKEMTATKANRRAVYQGKAPRKIKKNKK